MKREPGEARLRWGRIGPEGSREFIFKRNRQ
jgi:hypothetical protein